MVDEASVGIAKKKRDADVYSVNQTIIEQSVRNEFLRETGHP